MLNHRTFEVTDNTPGKHDSVELSPPVPCIYLTGKSLIRFNHSASTRSAPIRRGQMSKEATTTTTTTTTTRSDGHDCLVTRGFVQQRAFAGASNAIGRRSKHRILDCVTLGAPETDLQAERPATTAAFLLRSSIPRQDFRAPLRLHLRFDSSTSGMMITDTRTVDATANERSAKRCH